MSLRESLIEEATLMIQQKGVASVTLRALGQNLGVSRTAPYRHFEDKNDLLCAVAQRGFDQFRKVLCEQRLNDSVTSPLSRFQNMGMAYIEFALAHVPYYKLMFQEPSVMENKTVDLEKASSEAFGELVAILEECKTKGLVKNEPTLMMASFVWSTMHGFSSLLIDNYQVKHSDIGGFKDYMINKVTSAIQS